MAAAAGATSLLSTFSTVMGVVSAVSTIFGGQAENESAKVEASQVELQAQADRTQAAKEELNRQKRLQSILATQNATFAARGVAGGSLAAIQRADVGQANLQRGEGELLGDINSFQARVQSQQLKQAGRSKLLGSVVRAGSILGDTFIND